MWGKAAGGFAGLFALGVALPAVAGLPARLGQRWRTAPAPEREPRSSDVTPPSIDVVVPAYLEASVIGVKVRELRASLATYQGVGRVLVVASDQLTADAAVEACADQVIHTGRGGKPAAVNIGVAQSKADIMVVTDANCRIDPIAWPSLTTESLGQAGLVSAHKNETRSSERAFWAYERFVKRLQSGEGESLAVVGEFVAFRRRDFRPIPHGELIDDLWLALDFGARGHRVLVHGGIATTEPSAAQRDQWERRVRIAEGMIGQQLLRLPLFITFPAGRRFAVHKFYRLTIGCVAFWGFLICVALISPILLGPLLFLQATYAVARYSGLILPQVGLSPPTTLTGMQAVPVAAFFRVAHKRLRGTRTQQGWKKIAR